MSTPTSPLLAAHEHVGEARAPRHLSGAVGGARVHDLGEGVVGAGHEDEDLGLRGTERLAR